MHALPELVQDEVVGGAAGCDERNEEVGLRGHFRAFRLPASCPSLEVDRLPLLARQLQPLALLAIPLLQQLVCLGVVHLCFAGLAQDLVGDATAVAGRGREWIHLKRHFKTHLRLRCLSFAEVLPAQGYIILAAVVAKRLLRSGSH